MAGFVKRSETLDKLSAVTPAMLNVRDSFVHFGQDELLDVK